MFTLNLTAGYQGLILTELAAICGRGDRRGGALRPLRPLHPAGASGEAGEGCVAVAGRRHLQWH